MIQDPNAPLLSELRWFVVQRWRAGVIVIMGALLTLFWEDWSFLQVKILSVGIAILIYNLAFWALFWKSPRWFEFETAQRSVAWTQITLDLVCLTLLTAYTNGITSPLLGLFVLHMIFATLLLQPPRYTPYIAWVIASLTMASVLWFTGQWPDSTNVQLIAYGWMSTLLLTVYITTHVTQNMRSNHDRTRAVLAAAPDGVLTIDSFGCIELANPTALNMFGYTSAQIVGQPIENIVTNAALPHFAKNGTPSTTQTEQVEVYDDSESFATRRDGSTFPIELSINTMIQGGRNVFTTVIHDITDRKRNEATLRKLNDELTKHQEQLIQHEKMVAVGRMAAGVAHEIANPLANMDGLIQLVERNPERMKTELPIQLREQVKRITLIVRQLKDFAHPADSDRQTVSVDVLIQSALDMIRFDQRYRNISVDEKLANPCCHVHIHLQSILQVFVNLIVNALDAERVENHHHVTISSQCIEDQMCCIKIQDNGIGISVENLEQIFEPFFTTKPLGMGTGLGLSISYNLIQQDGGQIQIDSIEGEGTTVSIYLPVAGCSC